LGDDLQRSVASTQSLFHFFLQIRHLSFGCESASDANMISFVVFCFVLALNFASSLKFDIQQVEYNLNENNATLNPLEYSGEWPNHEYHPSPSNWRFPFYTLFLDRFVNGDPSNDDANGTVFEHDIMSNQFRHGGDIAGLVDTLDYIQGMGIKVSMHQSKACYKC
jgi:alpha-1,3-glucan synthase